MDSQTPAERLYHTFAARRDRGEAGDEEFEVLCREHPLLEASLRALVERDARLRGLLGKLDPSPADPHRSAFFRRDRAAPDPSSPSLTRSFVEGETIGDFTLAHLIGQGGMGQVWEARQNSMHRSVALKFLLPDRVDAQSLELFEREARAGGKANHPNLVRTLARGQTQGIEWIAQELVEGSYSLRNAIEEFRREEQLPRDYYQRVAEFVRDVARGMQAAHAAGVIHRDLKPQNILIDLQGQPKVADFGLARVIGDSLRSNAGEMGGTYQYMSPEQVTSQRTGLDHRTDIFSLGVVLYELLTLRRPFEGDTTQKIAAAIVNIDPPDPSKLRALCPRDLAVICAKAMQKRPDARYGSMHELAEDLQRHLRHEPILAQPATVLELARKWSLRHPAASVGLAAGCVALLVVSGVALVAFRQAQRAERGELSARQNLELAERSARESRRLADAEALARSEATRKTAAVLALSTQKDCEALVAEAEQLWPAHSAMIPRYEEWLRRASELIDGRAGDESRGIQRRPSLAEHKAQLAQMRLAAKPLSEQQIRSDRESHPRYNEWLAKRAQLLWQERMLGREPWPTESEIAAELDGVQLPATASGLNRLAWDLVDPNNFVHGQEVRARLLAVRALAVAEQDERAAVRESLGWALFRTGELDAALEQIALGRAEPGNKRLESSFVALEAIVARWKDAELIEIRAQHERLTAEVAELAAQTRERRTYEYDAAEQSWWDGQLCRLVKELESLQDPRTGLMGTAVSPAFGWGIARRLQFARTVRERTLTGPDARLRWDEALQAIAASERYRGTVFPGGRLRPQEGLLPIGPDPRSGLWEFWHVQSGDEPERDGSGACLRRSSGAHELVESGEHGTGIVLVLIPGGSFWMGAQSRDPDGPNFDPDTRHDELVHRVTLSPYFLSKYELTQGQWTRFTGRNPSNLPFQTMGPITGRHPVEQVSWLECETTLRALGLMLPSEAQWEFACRAGTNSPWWTGVASDSLAQQVNLADQTYVADGGNASIAAWGPQVRDGFGTTAPVGQFPANDFGLHEVAGNLWEWCADAYDSYSPLEAHDPLVEGVRTAPRVYRGGCFGDAPMHVRSASRGSNPPTTPAGILGVRPARAVQ